MPGPRRKQPDQAVVLEERRQLLQSILLHIDDAKESGVVYLEELKKVSEELNKNLGTAYAKAKNNIHLSNETLKASVITGVLKMNGEVDYGVISRLDGVISQLDGVNQQEKHLLQYGHEGKLTSFLGAVSKNAKQPDLGEVYAVYSESINNALKNFLNMNRALQHQQEILQMMHGKPGVFVETLKTRCDNLQRLLQVQINLTEKLQKALNPSNNSPPDSPRQGM